MVTFKITIKNIKRILLIKYYVVFYSRYTVQTFVSILIPARFTGYELSLINGDKTVIHSSGLIDLENVAAASSAARVT